MQIPQNKKEIHYFNLEDGEDRKEYEDLINDRSVVVLDKRFDNKTTTTSDSEGGSTSVTEKYVYLEVEKCRL